MKSGFFEKEPNMVETEREGGFFEKEPNMVETERGGGFFEKEKKRSEQEVHFANFLRKVGRT